MNIPKPRSRVRTLASRTVLAIALAAGFALVDMFFTVEEGRAVVVTRFGRPVREIVAAGPYWKWPSPVDQLHPIDRRRRILITPEVTTFTRDKKNIVLSTYVVWHIEQPLAFLQSVGNTEAAEANLVGMILAAKTQRIGKHDLSALISTQAEALEAAEIERDITAGTSQEALRRMGVVVDQVGFERIAFPPENLAAVFERMRSERKSEANRLRAEGARIAQSIRDETHVESQAILRQGREEASQIAAEAERQAAELLAKVQRENPGFYYFWSSLQASKRTLKEKSTLILTTDQLFFDGLNATPQLKPDSSLGPETSRDSIKVGTP